MLLAAMPTASAAQIHACRSDDGSVQFQDRPCERVVSADAPATGGALRTPLGLHASWFENPPAHSLSATCDASGCTCGPIRRPFEGGPEQGVADALYLDGAWHRLENGVGRTRSAPAARSNEAAVCDVLMSQQTLRVYAEPVFAAMRTRARDAENRGYHRPEACEAGEAAACEALSDYERYRRVAADSVTLRRARTETDAVPGTSPRLNPAALSSR